MGGVCYTSQNICCISNVNSKLHHLCKPDITTEHAYNPMSHRETGRPEKLLASFPEIGLMRDLISKNKLESN